MARVLYIDDDVNAAKLPSALKKGRYEVKASPPGSDGLGLDAASDEDLVVVSAGRLRAREQAMVAELSQANRRLEEHSRLRQEFLRNLSHEFATPMTPVVGYLRLLLNEELGPISALQRKTLESINTSTQKLLALIDTLLDVSHLDGGRLYLYERDYDFGDVVEKALDEVADSAAQRGVDILQEEVTTRLPARGDPDKLRRAMVHILDNAVKFTPRGHEIAVAVRALPHDGGYQLAVADSGPGISSRDRERIMQPFFQVDGSPTRSHSGVGLGLAYARHVAEKLGVGITVESPPSSEVAGRQLPGTCVRLSVQARPRLSEPTPSHRPRG
jgi:signal transduction histidine kinase